MLAEVAILLPLFICAVVSIALLLLFRTELKAGLRCVFLTLLTHACILKEVIKDIATRKRNIVEPASPAGNVAVVTGARGIGYEVIKKLMEKNFHVIIGCRDLSTGEKAVTQIREAGVTSGSSIVYQLDLSSLPSVRAFAQDVLQCHPEVHLLCNNAGVTLNKRELTEEGYEKTFATNYLGHCFLTHLLLARLAESARTRGIQARIVNTASVAHCFPLMGGIHFDDLMLRDNYNQYTAYCQSKLAQMMFTKTLDAHLRASGAPVGVFAVHPGIVHTKMVSQSFMHALFGCLFPLTLRSPEQGARSVYYACASPDLVSRSGAYIYSCRETLPGKCARSEEDQAKLWTYMMDFLNLKTFGHIE